LQNEEREGGREEERREGRKKGRRERGREGGKEERKVTLCLKNNIKTTLGDLSMFTKEKT
jgi:hypothetical protein